MDTTSPGGGAIVSRATERLRLRHLIAAGTLVLLVTWIAAVKLRRIGLLVVILTLVAGCHQPTSPQASERTSEVEIVSHLHLFSFHEMTREEMKMCKPEVDYGRVQMRCTVPAGTFIRSEE